MRRRMKAVGIQSDTLLKGRDGFIPLFQPHPGHAELKECCCYSRINLPRIFQGFDRFLRIQQTKVRRPFDEVRRR